MNRRKDLEAIQIQKDIIINEMAGLNADSEAYQKLQQRYNTFVDIEEKILAGRRSRGILDTGIKVGTLAISLVGSIIMPKYLAELAYENDSEYKLRNATIWNMIGRSFHTKKD